MGICLKKRPERRRSRAKKMRMWARNFRVLQRRSAQVPKSFWPRKFEQNRLLTICPVVTWNGFQFIFFYDEPQFSADDLSSALFLSEGKKEEGSSPLHRESRPPTYGVFLRGFRDCRRRTTTLKVRASHSSPVTDLAPFFLETATLGTRPEEVEPRGARASPSQPQPGRGMEGAAS